MNKEFCKNVYVLAGLFQPWKKLLEALKRDDLCGILNSYRSSTFLTKTYALLQVAYL